MINKVYELLGITDNEKAKTTFQRCVNYQIQGLDQLYLANLEGLVEQMGASDLDKDNAIDLRKKLNFIVETVIEGDTKKLSLYEQYYQTPNTSKVKSISKDNFKFAEPVKDTSGIKTISKDNYRFASDKDNLSGGLK